MAPPVTAGEFGTWTVIGAEQTAVQHLGKRVRDCLEGPGHRSIWVLEPRQQRQLCNKHPYGVGNELSGRILGDYFPSGSQWRRHHRPSSANTVIESVGVTSLVEVGNNYFLNPVAGGSGPELKYNRRPCHGG